MLVIRSSPVSDLLRDLGPQDALVWRLPEHLLQDILNLVLFLTQYHPATLGTAQMYPLMTTVRASLELFRALSDVLDTKFFHIERDPAKHSRFSVAAAFVLSVLERNFTEFYA